MPSRTAALAVILSAGFSAFTLAQAPSCPDACGVPRPIARAVPLLTSPRAMAIFDEDGAGPTPPRLFVAGGLTLAGHTLVANIARWDGAAFSDVGGGLGPASDVGGVSFLAVHNNGTGPALYAVG